MSYKICAIIGLLAQCALIGLSFSSISDGGNVGRWSALIAINIAFGLINIVTICR